MYSRACGVCKRGRILPICARCLFVSQPYGLWNCVFMLASRLSANKTSRFARQIAGGGISAKKWAGRVRNVAVDRLEVMQQCHSSTAARRSPRARQAGVTRDKYFMYANFCGLGLIRKNSKICLTWK